MRRSATNARFASGATISSRGLTRQSGMSVSASRWSVWLWLDVTTSTKSSCSGATTRRVIRTWGLSVSAYFFVSESER